MEYSWGILLWSKWPSFVSKIGLKSSQNTILQTVNWALIISLCAQLASAEKDAVVVLHSGDFDGDSRLTDEVTGQLAIIGSTAQDHADRKFGSGILRMVNKRFQLSYYGLCLAWKCAYKKLNLHA